MTRCDHVLINTSDRPLTVLKGGQGFTLEPGRNDQFSVDLVRFALAQFPGVVITEVSTRVSEPEPEPEPVILRARPTLTRADRLARLAAFLSRRIS